MISNPPFFDLRTDNLRKTDDIVLYLDMSQPRRERKGVLLCIRSDNESAFSVEKRLTYLRNVSTDLPNSLKVDTHIGRDGLAIQERERELVELLESFKRAEVVITDRLHGMIFSAITATPCVVLQSNNHKIKATCDTWLRPFEHIRLQKDLSAEETVRAVAHLKTLGKVERQLPHFEGHFEILKRVITSQ